MHRRDFLKSAGGIAALASLTRAGAYAADASGYKALVCVFLLGGMDHADTILPYDAPSYAAFSAVRAGLFSAHGASRIRGQLLPLQLQNQSVFGTRQFALPPELGPLHDLFTAGQMAIISDVGPLRKPMDRDSFERDTRDRPQHLFSHNDQQSTWMTLGIEGERVGWGGAFAEAAIQASAARNAHFSAFSTAGTAQFLSASTVRQVVLGADGLTDSGILVSDFILRRAHGTPRIRELLADHAAATGLTSRNLYEGDIIGLRQRGAEVASGFDQLWSTRAPLTAPFPASRLGAQLRSIAETISLNRELDVPRQIFFAAIGGYDTHSDQADTLPTLHRDLAGSIGAFYAAITSMGLAQNVTLFTASDFGRALIDNGNGTDHGWGGHQFVVGGAVKGGRIYGPMSAYDPENDRHTVNGGRLIPSLSVDQFAFPLGRWFGLDTSELMARLPNLSQFDPLAADFL